MSLLCDIKNEANKYRPSCIWLPDGFTIRDEIMKFMTEQILVKNAIQPVDPNTQQEDLNDSFGDDLGPRNQSPDVNTLVHDNASQERDLAAIAKYKSHHKRYMQVFSFKFYEHD